MDRLVLDTNVIVSAALNPAGPPAQLIRLAGARAVEFAVSPAILWEYGEVLSRAGLGLAPGRSGRILEVVRANAVDVVPSEVIRVCSDPDDDKFLECAFAAGAGLVITGNLRHFPREFSGILVLAPAAYLRRRGA